MPSTTIITTAIKKAMQADGEFRLAAVLYKGGAILRVTCNSPSPLAYRKKYFWHGDPSRHAELNVIHNIPRDIVTQCSMLVVRVNSAGELTSAKPCEACVRALQNANIKKVYYSSYSGNIERLDLHSINLDSYAKEMPIVAPMNNNKEGKNKK